MPYLFSLVLMLTACSPQLSYFTQRLYEENRWTDNELKDIQFYVSRDIVLRRQVRDGSSEIVEGKIRMKDGRKVEEIVIPRGTPGVFVFSPKFKRLAISFEAGDKDKYLMFGPNPKVENKYVLLASEWDRRQGKVTYDNRAYYVDADDAFAALMVDLKRVSRVSVRSRVAKGNKVD